MSSGDTDAESTAFCCGAVIGLGLILILVAAIISFQIYHWWWY